MFPVQEEWVEDLLCAGFESSTPEGEQREKKQRKDDSRILQIDEDLLPKELSTPPIPGSILVYGGRDQGLGTADLAAQFHAPGEKGNAINVRFLHRIPLLFSGGPCLRAVWHRHGSETDCPAKG